MKEEDPSAKLNPAIPAHMALLHRTLIERGQGEIAQDYLQSNSQSWPLQKRSDARTAMIDAKLPTPAQEEAIETTWGRATQQSTAVLSPTQEPTPEAHPTL